MAVNFVSVKCPECDAKLNIEEGRKKCFCSYCGTEILIDNDNEYEYTYHHIDEAELRKTDNDRIVELKRLELEEKKEEEKYKSKKVKTKIILISVISFIACFFFGIIFEDSNIPFLKSCSEALYGIVSGCFVIAFYGFIGYVIVKHINKNKNNKKNDKE